MLDNPTRYELWQAIVDGMEEASVAAVQTAIGANCSSHEVLEVIRGALQEVGERYEMGEIYLPELVAGGAAAEAALKVVLSGASDGESSCLGTVVIGTAAGDVHNLGKTIIVSMLASAGFKVHDLGVDISPEAFVDSARQLNADIVAVSALLSTSAGGLRRVEEALRAARLKYPDGKVRTLVGGAAVTAEIAASIGADGYCRDAGGVVKEAVRLMELSTR